MDKMVGWYEKKLALARKLIFSKSESRSGRIFSLISFTVALRCSHAFGHGIFNAAGIWRSWEVWPYGNLPRVSG